MKKIVFWFAALMAFVTAVWADDFAVPSLTGPVVDAAKLIPVNTRRALDHALRELFKDGGAQIQILTVPDLGGLTIEDASIRVVEKWRLGQQGHDNGILLMIARDERRVRIEVGRGYEGDLPDAYASRIIRETMTPLFKSGDYGSGIVLGVHQIISRVNPNIDQGKLFSEIPLPRGQRGMKINWFFVIIALLVLIFGGRSGMLGFILGSLLAGGRGSYGGSSGGSGWGGGGGGWSGGGGGFSGGGASGGW